MLRTDFDVFLLGTAIVFTHEKESAPPDIRQAARTESLFIDATAKMQGKSFEKAFHL